MDSLKSVMVPVSRHSSTKKIKTADGRIVPGSKLVENFDLPKNMKAVGRNAVSDTTLHSVNTALCLNQVPVQTAGQNILGKNPGVLLDSERSMVKTSRLIVKNLPNSITRDELKTIFSKEFELTDLQLKFKKDGKFRNFAFVGYKSQKEAADVKEAMDGTCVGSCKIQVEFCRKLYDDLPKEKPVKQSEDKDKDDNLFVEEFNRLENDPDFVEFLQEQRNLGSSKRYFWGNDDIPSVNDTKKVVQDLKKQEVRKAKPSVKGTYINTIKIKRFPADKCKAKFIKEFLTPLKPISIRVSTKPKGIAYASFKTENEVVKALEKNRYVYGGNLITVLRYEVKSDQPETPSNPKNRVEKQVSEDVLVDTGRLFVRNLYYQCTEQDLEKLFGQYGDIAEVHLPIDPETKKIKGFGFVTFVFPEHAIKAYNELDGTIFQGRTLHCIPGESKPEGKGSHLEAKSSFKRQKELENREKSSKGHNWNSLFLDFNAISDVISERYNVTKSQLLTEGKPSESIPVRMALAETQIVNETAKYLRESGVKLDAFGQSKVERSKSTFLLKNLPANTEIEELKNLIQQYGTIKKIVLPPLAVTALVEADNPVEARTMFKKLAYSNFHLKPLYLEWAPVNIFDNKSGTDLNDKKSKDQINDSVENTQRGSTIVDDNICEEETTILVKGMNFSTDKEGLTDHFSKCGRVNSVNIAMKKTSDGSSKSLGYGFVQFKERKAAQKAMKSLQSSVLDGFTLTLQLSRVKRDKADVIKAERDNQPRIDEQTGNKILVRNIPFEASEKDIEQLFEAFGQLKFARLPKKLTGTGSHRGFGFVEFSSKDDAKRAFDALSLSTHLLGRRLVLEWAAKEGEGDNERHESLESASRRTKFFIDAEPNKRFKKSVLVEDLNKSKKNKKMDDDFDDM